MKQILIFKLREVKMLEPSISVILKLLNTQMICKMFIKILNNAIQERNAKY